MLLTFLYMVATVTQSRRISFFKKHMQSIFKGNKRSSSFMLYIKSPQHLMNGDYNEPRQDENFMSSHLCLNKDLAKLGELLWYQDDMKLCTIYPQQQISVWDWVSCPQGNSLFPLNMNNSFKTSDEADHKMHILVEADLETYRPQTSMITTKLEDYGLITSWTTNDNISFILETNIDCITSFIIAIMQGQNYINNNLILTRIQSVVVSGKPCVFDSENSFLPPEKDILRAISHAARIASDQNKPTEVAQVSGVIVHPQNKDLNNETNSSPAGTTENNDVKTSSVSTPATPPSTPIATSVTKKPSVQPGINSSASTEKVPTATSGRENKFDDLAKTQLSSAMERKDNTLLDIDSKISTMNISQSKPTGKTDFPTASTSSKIEEKGKMSKVVKPPTIVVYADSPDAVTNVINVLEKTLEPDRYVIYELSREEARSNVWTDQVALAVICGNVDAEIGSQLVEYIIQGGKLLALCSDMLHTLLPSFKTAEVRENELVHFSYGKWKRVRMMHHIFCYHASPVRARFSQDQEDTRSSVLNPPTSTRIKDKRGEFHSFDVKVLGTEETWHNPSILLATLASSGGKVVFSQIHLEVDPTQYEYEEYKFKALKESNAARLEIINDLLSTHLRIETTKIKNITEPVKYTHGYFLGKFEMKVRMLRNLKGLNEDDVLTLPKLVIQFYKDARNAKAPSATFLPIMMHLCPTNFSTVDYYNYLITKALGRLVIYAEILTSSMHATEGHLEHGLTVIPRQQTQGHGRGRNVWLSPIGCAMFTVQVHIPKDSILGSRISLLQHIAAVALVSAVRSQSGYEDIDLRLKWPNDIYANSTKIGGLIVSTLVEQSLCICNVGAGVNLSNSKPTTCINDVIVQYNQKHGTKLDTFSYEKYLAFVFNELEHNLDKCQNDHMESFYDLYYKYWLHKNANVTVIDSSGKSKNVTILGIDDFGFLKVRADTDAIFTVHPDGNSFDLLKGLISPN